MGFGKDTLSMQEIIRDTSSPLCVNRIAEISQRIFTVFPAPSPPTFRNEFARGLYRCSRT